MKTKTMNKNKNKKCQWIAERRLRPQYYELYTNWWITSRLLLFYARLIGETQTRWVRVYLASSLLLLPFCVWYHLIDWIDFHSPMSPLLIPEMASGCLIALCAGWIPWLAGWMERFVCWVLLWVLRCGTNCYQLEVSEDAEMKWNCHKLILPAIFLIKM